jgi:hypothetical protein
MTNNEPISMVMEVLMQLPWADLSAHDMKTIKDIFNSSNKTASSGRMISE